MLWVSSSVSCPMRAAASAASVPAWPPPMTMTEYSLENRMALNLLDFWQARTLNSAVWNHQETIDPMRPTNQAPKRGRDRGGAGIAVAVIVTLLLGMVGILDSVASPAPQIGQIAPDFTAEDSKGA